MKISRKKGDFNEFSRDNDLIDTVPRLNPSTAHDPTYLCSHKKIDYILLSPNVAEITV